MKRTDDQSLLCGHGEPGLDGQCPWRPVGAGARGQEQAGGKSATGRQPPGRRQVVPRWRVKEGKLEGRAALGSRAVSCHDATASALPESHSRTQTHAEPRCRGRWAMVASAGGFWLERSLRHDPGFPHVDPPNRFTAQCSERRHSQSLPAQPANSGCRASHSLSGSRQPVGDMRAGGTRGTWVRVRVRGKESGRWAER
jgi:hypothetical protein